MDEHYFEKLLNIKTAGKQKDYNESLHYNRYEPTSYVALEKLFNSYKFKSTDSIVDFGCGKGRLNFYANYIADCKVTGIEMDHYYFNECLKNKNSYLNQHNKNTGTINFINCFAEKYEINDEDNIFYFFNPFSVQIFMKVLDNILLSVEECQRDITIILYYPSDEYIYFLETYTAFTLDKDIQLDGLYDQDKREKFLVYKLNIY